MNRIAVIGAGAAGCFCSIELKRRLPDAQVDVFEAGAKALVKVSKTGGGRCNLTNSFENVPSPEKVYPRGSQLMKRALRAFSQNDCMRWFEAEGVKLVTEGEGRVFPRSGDAMEIVRTLLRVMKKEGVSLHCGCRVSSIEDNGGVYAISYKNANGSVCIHEVDKVVVTTGGSIKDGSLKMLEPLNLETVPPVPSLYTFNIEDEALRSIMGTVAENAAVRLAGTPFKAEGPLLVTHWGLSGPGVLRLSSFAARYLAQNSFKASLLVSWCTLPQEEIRKMLETQLDANPGKLLSGIRIEGISARLWEHLIARAGLRSDIRCAETGRKSLNRLVEILSGDCYGISGKGQWKEEFVTCGGVALSQVDTGTLECRSHPGLFFAGEVLDLDALTGGFNLQAAWSTGFVAAKGISGAK